MKVGSGMAMMSRTPATRARCRKRLPLSFKPGIPSLPFDRDHIDSFGQGPGLVLRWMHIEGLLGTTV
jgi:hypothetical protein